MRPVGGDVCGKGSVCEEGGLCVVGGRAVIVGILLFFIFIRLFYLDLCV